MSSPVPIVFVGPTLPAGEVRALLPEAVVLPPVAQGDVLRALRRGPSALGIIDGVFDRVPAVWHKEILFALAEGVPVLGAASMGALRAAELAEFGMIGVGAIFAGYRDGAIEDDDEVAVAHAAADGNFRELSDAMVNIRATTSAAAHLGLIGVGTKALLDRAAKALFYPDRTFVAAIEGASALGGDAGELAAFASWWPNGRVHVKRDDARQLLAQMRELDGLVRPTFTFAHTVFFAEAMASAPWDVADDESAGASHGGVLDELRLQPGSWRDTMHAATLRALAEGDADARGLKVSDEALLDTTTAFRRERGLHDTGDLAAWLDHNELAGGEFIALMEQQTRLGWLQRSSHQGALDYVPDELRANGRWPALKARALAKAKWIEAEGLALTTLEDLALREPEVLYWYFAVRLGRAVPADLWTFAQANGFEDVEEFRRAVTREFLYATRSRQAGEDAGDA